VRHRRDKTRIRRAKPLVNRVRKPRANDVRRQFGGPVSGHHVRAWSCAAHRRRQGPKARGTLGGAKRSALYGAEHSAMLSHVMADRLAPREPIANRWRWHSASHVTMSKRCGQERVAEVVNEESVNGDQDARHRPALPPW
jgi:hypothetical protein